MRTRSIAWPGGRAGWQAEIRRTRDGLDLLGYRVFPDFVRLRDDNGHRFARRLRDLASGYAAGRVGWAEIDPRVQSWIGHARQADSEGLRRVLLGSVIFRRVGEARSQATLSAGWGGPQASNGKPPAAQG